MITKQFVLQRRLLAKKKWTLACEHLLSNSLTVIATPPGVTVPAKQGMAIYIYPASTLQKRSAIKHHVLDPHLPSPAMM